MDAVIRLSCVTTISCDTGFADMCLPTDGANHQSGICCLMRFEECGTRVFRAVADPYDFVFTASPHVVWWHVIMLA